MKERLLLFIQKTGLNPARFAEKLGIQRSAISHVLSGRNKPSYDFLLRIIENFPQIELEWLLTGKGNMLKPGSIDSNDWPNIIFDNDSDMDTETEELKNIQMDNPSLIKDSVSKNASISQDSINLRGKSVDSEVSIEKIVVLFRDKTFFSYKPK